MNYQNQNQRKRNNQSRIYEDKISHIYVKLLTVVVNFSETQ